MFPHPISTTILPILPPHFSLLMLNLPLFSAIFFFTFVVCHALLRMGFIYYCIQIKSIFTSGPHRWNMLTHVAWDRRANISPIKKKKKRDIVRYGSEMWWCVERRRHGQPHPLSLNLAPPSLFPALYTLVREMKGRNTYFRVWCVTFPHSNLCYLICYVLY